MGFLTPPHLGEITCYVCGSRISKPRVRGDRLCTGGKSNKCFHAVRAFAQSKGMPFFEVVRLGDYRDGRSLRFPPRWTWQMDRIAANQVATDAWLEAGSPPVPHLKAL